MLYKVNFDILYLIGSSKNQKRLRIDRDQCVHEIKISADEIITRRALVIFHFPFPRPQDTLQAVEFLISFKCFQGEDCSAVEMNFGCIVPVSIDISVLIVLYDDR